MRRLATLAVVVVSVWMSTSARAETLEWIRQLGTSEEDASKAVSADGLGNVYITGKTYGNLGGPNAGYVDAFLSKYDESGPLVWTQQFGTSLWDKGQDVSADGLGSVYITGTTSGKTGEWDVFLRKYDASGTHEWTRQFGTSSLDISRGVSADGMGNVYIAGYTAGNLGEVNAGGRYDAFLRKYDASGTLVWHRLLGTSSKDIGHDVSADGLGSVYISGYTEGSLGGPNAGEDDAFLSKYDESGTLVWTQQFGTSEDDFGAGVSADGLGNVYISGGTNGNLGGVNAGDLDAFLSKYDASGTLEWTRQFGTSSYDLGWSVSADGLGNAYIVGVTGGSLDGPNAGDWDVFLRKYDESGTHEWTQQLGTSEFDSGSAVSADGLGNVYISGTTRGSLEGTNAGDEDAFVAKFTDLPDLLLGDVNLDGDVNGLDVDPFVEVLLNGTDDNATRVVADMNSDGEVNGLDVDPFVAAVVGGTQPVPEPSTLLLCILALGVIGAWRKWGV